MTKEQIIGRVLAATPEQLDAVAAALDGAVQVDRRVMSLEAAGREIGRSTTTVRRMLDKGVLVNVPKENGERQVLSQSITDYLNRRVPANAKRKFKGKRKGEK